MTAQHLPTQRVLLHFASFLDDLNVSRETNQQSQLLLTDLLAYQTDVATWTPKQIAKELSRLRYQAYTGDARNLVMRFVEELPPLQARIVLKEYLQALEGSGCLPSTIKNYRSDISQFLIWAGHRAVELTLTKPIVAEFLKYQRLMGLKTATLVRRLVALAQFASWLELEQRAVVKPKEIESLKQAILPDSLSVLPKIETSQAKVKNKENTNSRFKPFFSARASQDFRANLKAKLSLLTKTVPLLPNQAPTVFLPYVNLFMIVLFFLGLGVFGFQQFSKNVTTPFAYPSTPNRPNRTLSFQGRLTDTAQSPITTATNMRFYLYDSGPSTSGGTQLWDSGTCSVTPDQDGIFSVGLGDDCGTEITSSVFSEYANVWLQVQIAAETLSPRQKIKSVAYALNSETLQGYPINSTGAATVSTVVTMNTGGEVVLGENSPTIRSVSGTFSLEAQSLLLQTSSGSNGNIVIDPDGTGIVQVLSSLTDLQGYLAAPGATLSATYAGGTALVAKGGPSGTGNILEIQNSAGSALSVIDESGNIGLGTTQPGYKIESAGDIMINNSGKLLFTETDVYLDRSGSNTLRYMSNGRERLLLSDTEITVDSNGASVDFRVAGTTDENALFVDSSAQNVGIGTSNPASFKLQVAGSIGPNLDSSYNLGSLASAWASIYSDAIYQNGNLVCDNSGANCPSSFGVNYWRLASGAFSPVNDTADLLIGSNASASAKFAFLNVNGGTPTASVSGNSGNIATYLTGDGTLATTNRQTLTIGNSTTYNTTGNVLIHPNETGNVGIGTTSPAYPLHVVRTQDASSYIYIRNNNVSTNAITGLAAVSDVGGVVLRTFNSSYAGSAGAAMASSGQLRTDAGLANGFSFATGAGPLKFLAADVEYLRITSVGNVGIGTTTPLSKLAINGDFAANAATISATYAGGKSLVVKGGPSGTANIQEWQNSAGTALSVVDASGNIGIGSTAPAYKLDVTGPGRFSSYLILGTSLLTSNGSAAAPSHTFTSEQTMGMFRVTTATLGFGTGSTERMRIDANGNVGIGTTNPSSFKLQVAGGIGPDADSTYELGTLSSAWASIYGDAIYGEAIYQNGNLVCDNTGANCPSSFGVNYWRLASGAFSPVNDTADLLIGSNASASAKFAFLNVNGGTPTASVSGNSGNIATYITGTGELGTTNRQTLALGGTATGNITLSPGGAAAVTALTNGNVGIGTTSPQALLETSTVGNGRFVRLGGGTENIRYNDQGLKVLVTLENLITSGQTTDSGISTVYNLARTSDSTARKAGGIDVAMEQEWTPTASTNDSYMRFFTTEDGTSGEKLRIVSSGNVGIGTTAPTGLLHANGAPKGKALAVLNETGDQNILVASASGTNQFTLSRTGDLTIVGQEALHGATVNDNYGLNIGSLTDSQRGVNTSLTASGIGAFSYGTYNTLNSTGNGSNGIGTYNTLSSLASSGNAMGVYNSFAAGASTGVVAGMYNSITVTNSTIGNRTAYGTYTEISSGAGNNEDLVGSMVLATANSSADNVYGYYFGDSSTAGTSYGFFGEFGSQATDYGIWMINESKNYLSGSLGVGVDPVGKLHVNGIATGKALTILNETGDQNILTASASGTTVLNFDRSGNLAIEGQLSDLGGTTLTINDDLSIVGGDITGANSAAIDIGEATSGDIEITGDLLPTTDATYDVGSTTKSWQSGYFTGSLCFDDTDCASTWTNFGSYWRLANGALSPVNDTTDILIGGNASTSAKIALININGSGIPVASISANAGNNATYITGDGTIATTSRLSLTLGTSRTGNILLNPGNTPTLIAQIDGNVGIGSTSPFGKLQVSGAATGKSLLILNETGDQNIFTASASGTTMASLGRTGNLAIEGQLSDLSGTTLEINDDVQINGNLTLSGADITGANSAAIDIGEATSGDIEVTGDLLPTTDATYDIGSTTKSWKDVYVTGQICFDDSDCASTWVGLGGGSNYWRLASGAFSPVNDTADLLIGSNASASAKFAFLNVNGGTPTASVSGNSGNIATYITGAGELGTTNRQTLALGGTATGNITLSPGGATAVTALTNGNVGIGTSTPAYKLQVSGDFRAGLTSTNRYASIGTSGILTSRYDDNAIKNTLTLENRDAGVGDEGTSILYNLAAAGTGSVAINAGRYVVQKEQAWTTTASTQDSYMSFETTLNGTMAEKLRINSDGNVGIGTTGIAAKLAVQASASEALLIAKDSGSNTRLTITNDGFIDLGSTDDPNQYNNVFTLNSSVVGASEIAGGFGNGFVKEQSTNRSFLNLVTNSSVNSLLSGGVSGDGYRSFAMTGAGVWTVGPGTSAGDTTFSRLSGGGWQFQTTATAGISAAVAKNSGQTGDLFQVRSVGASTGDYFAITADGNVGIGSATPNGLLQASGAAKGKALSIFNETGDQAVLTASVSGSTKFIVANSGNVGIGTSAPADLLDVQGGNIRIGAKADTAQSAMQTWSKISNSTAGTITGGGSSSIASASASVVYNGSLYIGTSKSNTAEVYRYDGGTTWTRVTSVTPGTIVAAGTANIDGIASMTVYAGQLYIGTLETNSAEVYRYDGGTTWTKVSNTTAGTIESGGTASIDGVTAMAVFGGKLYAGTQEGGKAELLRYDGGTTWSDMNTTPGTFINTNSVAVDKISSMVVFRGSLFLGTQKTLNSADVLRWSGTEGGGVTVKANSDTSGSFGLVGTSAIAEVNAMVVYDDKLIVGVSKPNAADIYMLSDNGMQTAVDRWVRLNSAAGTIVSGGTANIDGIGSLAIYKGRLYATTTESNTAQVYSFEGVIGTAAGWTEVSAAAGTFLTTASIDGALLQVYNNDLLALTNEAASAEVYSYTSTISESYQLVFNAKTALSGGEQNSLTNDGRLFFTASSSASVNSASGNTGNFVFSHGIKTDFGGYDLAEDYPTRDDALQPGDVVSLDPYDVGMVTRSSGAYEKYIVGVYSTKPALRLSQSQDTINGGTAIPVALAGRVPVRVSTENGEIKPGDLITSSSVAGVAMKATKSGHIVGKALTGYSGEGIGTVDLFMSIGVANASIDDLETESENNEQLNLESLDPALDALEILNATESGSIQSASASAALSNNLLTKLNLKHLNIATSGEAVLSQNTDGTYQVTLQGENHPLVAVSAFAESIIGTLKTGLLQTEELVVNTSARISSLTVQTMQVGDQTLREYIAAVVEDIQNATQGEETLITPLALIEDASISGQLVTRSLNSEHVNTNSLEANKTRLGSLLADTAIITELQTEHATVTGQLIATNLTAGQLNANSARIQQLETKIAQFEEIKIKTAQIVDATISGTLYAENINDFEQKIASALKKPSLLETIFGNLDQQSDQNIQENLAQIHAVVESAGIATSSGELNKTLADLNLSAEDVTLNASALFVDEYLKVNKSAYVAASMGIGQDLVVGKNVSIGTGMHLADGLIEYTSTSYQPGVANSQLLAIQPSGKGSLSLMAGLMSLTEDGNVYISGNLAVGGNLTVKDTLLSNLVTPTDFGNPFQVQVAGVSTASGQLKESRFEIVNESGTPVATISAQGKAAFAGGIAVGSQDLSGATLEHNQAESDKSSGKAKIAIGQKEITINSKLITPDSLIYVTPTGSTKGQVLYVKSQAAAVFTGGDPNVPQALKLTQTNPGSFVVGFDNPVEEAVSLNWWIIN